MIKFKVNLIVALIYCFFSGQASGQEYLEIKLPKPKRSFFLTTFDSTAINIGLVDKVTSRLGFSDNCSTGSSKTYKTGMSVSGIQITTFSDFTFNTKLATKLKIEDSLISAEPNKQVYIYGFTSVLNDGNRVNKNYSKFLMSAYLQEYDKAYATTPGNFTPFVVKDKAEFKKRSWMNMGYGMSYLAKDNPFMGGKSFNVKYFYVWEALHYIAIFGGPFLGNTTEDKILISVTGLSSLIAQKAFMNLVIGNKYLTFNKSIYESGYKIPNNLDY